MTAKPVATGTPSLRGRRFLAMCATFVFTGLGHAIAGRWRRGLFWLGCDIVLGVLGCLAFAYAAFIPALLILVPLSLALGITVIVDACKVARRSSSPMLHYPVLRYLVGVLLIAGLFVLRPTRTVYAPLYQRYIANAFVMTSHSMAPIIEPHDHVLASRLQTYSRWSIVVFRYPEDPKIWFVMRIAGLPEESIEIQKGKVLINGHAIAQPAGINYTDDDPRIHQGVRGKPMKLGPDEYFVLGDESKLSNDSRLWTRAAPGHQPGAVPAANIYGPVTWIYWPMNRIRRVYRSVPLTVPAP